MVPSDSSCEFRRRCWAAATEACLGRSVSVLVPCVSLFAAVCRDDFVARSFLAVVAAVGAAEDGGAPPASPHVHACGKHMEQPSIELGVLQMCVAALYGATMILVGSQHRSRCEVCCSNVCVPLIAPERRADGPAEQSRARRPRHAETASGAPLCAHCVRACACLSGVRVVYATVRGAATGGVAKASGPEQQTAAAAQQRTKPEDSDAATDQENHTTPHTTHTQGKGDESDMHRGCALRNGQRLAAGSPRRAGLPRAVVVAFVGCAAFPARSTNHAR